MTLNRFRIAGGALVGFNVVGMVVTWLAHLQKRGTSIAHATLGGTQFTGPIVLIVLGAVCLAITFSAGPGRALNVAVFLLGLWGLGFTVGEVGELFSHNVGISSTRWDIVLGGAVIGAVIGISTAVTAAMHLASERKARRLPDTGQLA